MKIESWSVDKPIPYARNARVVTDMAINKLAASLHEYGWKQPIVVDKDGVIIAGHTRLLAAQKLAMKKVPVFVAKDLSPQQVKAYRLADNRTAQETSWDKDLLAIELGEFNLEVPEIALITGFGENEIRRIAEIMDEDTDYSDEEVNSVYFVVVPCTSESQQESRYKQLTDLGIECKIQSN